MYFQMASLAHRYPLWSPAGEPAALRQRPPRASLSEDRQLTSPTLNRNRFEKSSRLLGGGTAGWITAGVLAARYPRRGDGGITVTLVESRQQPPIGVGEGTWPTMRATLKQIGVTETDFLRACDASFKQGSHFVKWVDGSDTDAYYHPFTLPMGQPKESQLRSLLAGGSSQGQSSFAGQHVCFQTEVCSRALAPKQITTPEFTGLANYAYHLDALA